MPRVLKSRNYTTSELLEIADQLFVATEAERQQCYTSSEREKNSIRLAFFRQIKARLDKDLQKEQKNTATQSGLF